MSSTSRRARVVAIHPQDHSCDVIVLNDGSRWAGVQIMSGSASTNTGLNDLPVPAPAPDGNHWNSSQKTARDIIAIIDWCEGSPYITGFLFPQICQMTFPEGNRKIDRHASDFYHTIDGAGNAEWYHPSGTYLRMGASPAHEDLTGKDFDKKWSINNNTASAPHVQLVVANAGAVKATINIDPAGNLTVTSASGAAVLKFPGGTTIESPLTTFTGDVKVNKNIKADLDITDKVRSMAADRVIYNGHTNPNNGNNPPPQQM
ncbi:hypothetical protein [Pseudomonas sp. Q1]|uniref:hypothetical protein n=1 Tax=Pseudomonas sp. Q1 TaxID=2202823 RepID=UPI001374A75F|nr:hypothetical protein [Pseudomonas sp. Q1]NCE85290.1 hypothetical protein [Pseudomonas sp. Q1]